MAEEHHDDLLTQALLLDEIGQSVIGMDSLWRITYWNRASERLYGYPAAEALGSSPLDLGIIDSPSDATGPGPTGEEIAERVSRGRDWAGELWVRHRSGRQFPVHSTISPIRGRHTVPVDIVAISKDITDRKHTEAVLRRLSAMVESSGDAIIGADMDGRITSWNAGAARMFGWSSAEAVGQTAELLTARDTADLDDRVAAQIRSGAFVTGLEAQWRRKDGSLMDVELTVSPVYDQDGTLTGASGIARDITEIKRLRAEAVAERRRRPRQGKPGTRKNWPASWACSRENHPARSGCWSAATRRTGRRSARSGRICRRGRDLLTSNTASSEPTENKGGCTPGYGACTGLTAVRHGSLTRYWISRTARTPNRSWSGRPAMTP